MKSDENSQSCTPCVYLEYFKSSFWLVGISITTVKCIVLKRKYIAGVSRLYRKLNIMQFFGQFSVICLRICFSGFSMNKEWIFSEKLKYNIMSKKNSLLRVQWEWKKWENYEENRNQSYGSLQICLPTFSGLGNISIFSPVFSTLLAVASVFLSLKVLCSLADFLSYPALNIISKPSAKLLKNDSIRILYS